MTLTVAVQMDPIQRIRIAGDSTFALLLEAQSRGHTLLTIRPTALLRDGHGVVAGPGIEVRDVEGDHFTWGGRSAWTWPMSTWCFLRQDRLRHGLHHDDDLLERILPGPVVNDPHHVRNAPEKIFVTAVSPT
jgi:glutathione synthase